MSRSEAISQILRITPLAPVDIDDVVYSVAPRASTPGRDLFPEGPETAFPGVAEAQDKPVVGFRVATPIADPADLAMKMAALAAEKDVAIVVLSHLDYCGLERFGLRVERIAGPSAETRAVCEAEVKWFWGLGVVL